MLAVSAMTAMQGLSTRVFGMTLIAVSVLGAAEGASVLWRLLRGKAPAPPHWTDHWCYGVGPTAAYLAIGAAGVAFVSDKPWAALVLAAVLLATLMLAIRNAWDLVTWLVATHGSGEAPPDAG